MKPARKIKYFLAILLTAAGILTSGCKEKKHEPEDINQLAEVYVELTVAREQYAAVEDSTKLQQAVDSIYTKFGFTDESYEKELKSIEPSSEVWEDFFAHANSYLDTLKAHDKKLVK